MADTPQLGYGQRDGAPIDAVNQWFRSTPEYQAKLASMGVDPRNVRLNDQQKQELVRLAQSLGVVVDEGHDGQEIDDSGNFRAKGHKLRNTLIVAGIAGAALATMGAAGVFAGGAGAGAGAAGASSAATAAGSVLPSTVIGSGFIPAIAGGTGLASAAGAGLAGLAGAGAEGAFDAAGNFIGDTTINSIAGGSGAGLSAAERIAALAGKVGGATDAVSTALNGGQDPMLAGTGAANAAAQAARNRIDGARVDQGGPVADKTALSNMRTAGLMANFKGSPASDYGSPAIDLGQGTKDFAAQFQAELQKRQAAGKSATTFGVPDPTPQELADEQKARDIAAGKSGLPGTAGKVVDGIGTGARLARLLPGLVNTGKDIWSLF